MTELSEVGKQIGVVTQIINNENIFFIINNNVGCVIGNIIGLKNFTNEFILACVDKIEVDFYLENSKQFFISRAVDNDINKINEPNNKPRFGQYITANILGYYKFSENGTFEEDKTKINKYTPYIFQPVYQINFSTVPDLYGLYFNNIFNKSVYLGDLVFPTFEDNNSESLYFDLNTFRRHTLITGVTGSGKSRLSALMIKEIAGLGGHINVLDPHDEYAELLVSSKRYSIEKINSDNITFSENYITPDALTKLLPGLTVQQTEAAFEIFSYINVENITIQKLMERLVEELIIEFEKDLTKDIKIIKQKAKGFLQSTKDYTAYIILFVGYLKKEVLDSNRANKTHVLVALISKINELRANGILSTTEPTWLSEFSNSIDIFNIDYSSNESIRRFINSIIQFLLRKRGRSVFRTLVIDEAHMLLKENSETLYLLKQLLREARKFNIAVIFISQNYTDIPVDIVNQFQNQFRFRQKDLEETRFFPDQICDVSLYGSKLNFAMKVVNVKSTSE